MSTPSSADKATLLRQLHRPGKPLLLANIWDADSARQVVAAGFPAVATSSGAVAESLGYADHQGAPAEEMFAAAARVCAAVSVPVTVDAEGGYDLSGAEFAQRLVAAGAVGCNLEDSDHAHGGLKDADRHAAWLAEVRKSADRLGVPLVLNARVDVFVQARTDPDDEHTLLDEAVRRAEAYYAAGADCVYPILVRREDTLRRFTEAVGGRCVNALCLPGGISLDAARVAGVARVSLGTGLWRAQQSWLASQLAARLADWDDPPRS